MTRGLHWYYVAQGDISAITIVRLLFIRKYIVV